MQRVGTLDRAHGRWREILPKMGVDERFLRNKHGPCPICGGKDRFRLDDKLKQGNYYCGQCGPGTGFTMLQKMLQRPNAEILKAIDEIIGTEYRPPAPSQADKNDRRKTAAIARLIGIRSDDSIVEGYLQSRGLSVTSTELLGNRACPYFDGRQHVGDFPAVVAPILSPTGKTISAHRIYITDVVEDRKKFMALASCDTLNGAAVRLFEADEDLGIAEGIETALAAHQLFGVPVWSVLNANGIRTFRPPEIVRTVHIFGDNDDSGTGQAASWELYAALKRGGLDARVNIPPEVDTDWLNVLVGRTLN